MKLISPLPHKRGRLEIIPLIDIMFFLLAAFMVVSINKIRIDSLKISLPTDVPAAQHETKEDFINVAVTADGQVRIDKQLVARKEDLLPMFKEIYAKNKDQKILISADTDATHGNVITLLGKIRAAGFQKVAFSIKGDKAPGINAGANAGGTTAPGVATAGTPAPASSSAIPVTVPAPSPAPTPAATAPVPANTIPSP